MSGANADQRDFWSERAGPVWVARMQAMDAALAPVLEAVLEAADLREGQRVLDIGCGAGTSTLAAAERVGAEGMACGLDISDRLLAAAQDRADGLDHARFLLADAQTHDFGAARFDCLMSRFGVMFFDDFDAAFANLHSALRGGGGVAIATWGTIPENPYFTLPARVAREVLGPVPKSDPDAPGPFALRDPERVRAILEGAGFEDVRVEERRMMLTPPGDARQVTDLMCDIGPAQSAISHHGADSDQQQRLRDALAGALAQFGTADGIRIPALINIVTARKAA